jgi:single-strand DNA-binding protein
VFELDVDEVGPSLRYATAKVNKAARTSSGGSGAPADDPWGAAPTAGNGGLADEPPF